MTELTSFGYAAIFAGALVEGEATLLAAGIAAQLGFLELPLVISIGALGAAVGDQTWFLLGRWKGHDLLARFPALAAQHARLRPALYRHPAVAILLVRFVYGFRTAAAALLGAAKLRTAKFSALNLLSAAVWATLIAGAAYAFGSTLEGWFVNLRQIEIAAVTALALGVGSLWLRRRPWARSGWTANPRDTVA